MKKSYLKIFFVTILTLFLCWGCKKNSSNLNVAFYGIENDFVLNGLQLSFDKIAEKNNLTFNYAIVNLDDEFDKKSLSPDLIISSAGFATNSSVKLATNIADSSLLTEMTSSIRNSAKIDDDFVKALPFLNDFMNLEVNYLSYPKSELEKLSNLDEFSVIAKTISRRTEEPIVFAGKNPRNFFDIMGALSEALDGVSSYNQAAKILSESKGKSADEIAKLLCDNSDSPFASTISYLKNWDKNHLICDSSYLNFSERDVDAYAENDLCKILFMKLSDHRSCKNLKQFSQIYFPSKIEGRSRRFTANIIYAIPTSKNKNLKNVLAELVNSENQAILARNTGLAPVLTQARVPDIQSDDARFYVAASSVPLAGLGFETNISSENLTKIAREIRSRIY